MGTGNFSNLLFQTFGLHGVIQDNFVLFTETRDGPGGPGRNVHVEVGQVM